jgi:hypothetical protein
MLKKDEIRRDRAESKISFLTSHFLLSSLSGFIEICSFLTREVEKRFPVATARFVAVGGFLFLRLLCPAVVSPEAHDLAPSKRERERERERGRERRRERQGADREERKKDGREGNIKEQREERETQQDNPRPSLSNRRAG